MSALAFPIPWMEFWYDKSRSVGACRVIASTHWILLSCELAVSHSTNMLAFTNDCIQVPTPLFGEKSIESLYKCDDQLLPFLAG